MNKIDAKPISDIDAPFWTEDMNPSTFSKIQRARLQAAHKAFQDLKNISEKHTVENTLVIYDQISIELDAVLEQSSLLENVHPDKEFRETCEQLSQEATAFYSEISLSRETYLAIDAIDSSKEDAPTKHYIEKILEHFRLSGVDKDEPTREKVKALNDEILLIGQEFARNIRNGKRSVTIQDSEMLEGLPEDFISNHQPDESGNIILSTDYPDSIPILSYAKSDSLRRKMHFEVNNRATPENKDVLHALLSKRFELAQLLGFANYADLITADKMIGSGKNASNFISRINDASYARTLEEYNILLKRKQKDDPAATKVFRWEMSYYKELVAREDFDFDSQSIREYYAYENVKSGILDVMSRLFEVTFKNREDAPVWHEKVECWEMFEGSNIIGRFYLDMHPREGKYSHAAEFGIRTGVEGKQIPEAALVCNFPEPNDDNPALMEQSDVETFFHEFGHLLHTLFASKTRWIGVNGIKTEWDFVEAPSQLLEEWARDAETLQTFAKHFKTEEPIPTKLVEQLNHAKEFGKGIFASRQMEFARISLSLYDRDPNGLDIDELVKEIAQENSPFEFVEDTHIQNAFGHLDSYSAIYYTYMWSLVLAKDLFSKFDKRDLLKDDISVAYRKSVLEPGGSKPAKELVVDFLGRESNFDAFQSWLNR